MIWRMLMGGQVVRTASLLVRVGLGCLFIYSALPKIRQPYDFLHSVYSYEIVGPTLGLLAAIILPWVELLTGVCLIGGIFVSGALLVSVGMSAMFTFVVGWALYQGLEISCGCFGSDADKITFVTLIRTCSILLISTVACVCIDAVGLGVKPHSEPSAPIAGTGMDTEVCAWRG